MLISKRQTVKSFRRYYGVCGNIDKMAALFNDGTQELAAQIIDYATLTGTHMAFQDSHKTSVYHIGPLPEGITYLSVDASSEVGFYKSHQYILATVIFNGSNIWMDSSEDVNLFMLNFGEHFKKLDFTGGRLWRA